MVGGREEEIKGKSEDEGGKKKNPMVSDLWLGQLTPRLSVEAPMQGFFFFFFEMKD